MTEDESAQAYRLELESFEAKHRGNRLASRASATPPGLVISIDGSLDSSNANDFQKLVLNGLGEAIRMGGLILNLERLNYASSAGIGSFTVILVETRKRQLPLYLHRMPKSVASVLDLLGFTSFFAFIDDYEARR